MKNGKRLVVSRTSARVVREIILTFGANSFGLLLLAERIDDRKTSNFFGRPESSLGTAIAVRNISLLLGVAVVGKSGVATGAVLGTSIIGVNGVSYLTFGALGGLERGGIFSLKTIVDVQVEAAFSVLVEVLSVETALEVGREPHLLVVVEFDFFPGLLHVGRLVEFLSLQGNTILTSAQLEEESGVVVTVIFVNVAGGAIHSSGVGVNCGAGDLGAVFVRNGNTTLNSRVIGVSILAALVRDQVKALLASSTIARSIILRTIRDGVS